MNPYDLMSVALLVQQMRDNAKHWHDAGPAEQLRLTEENRTLATRLKNLYRVPVVYDQESGTWHVGSVDGPLLFDVY